MDGCKEAVDVAKEHGIDYLKFQLFGNDLEKNGNICFPSPWNETWPALCQYAKSVDQRITASVFSDDAINLLLRSRPDFVKIAYSKKHILDWQDVCVANGVPVIVTCDVMTTYLPRPNTKRLWTKTVDGKTVYPVHERINFADLFDTFYGFSDHTYHSPINAEAAMRAGAKMIEFHMSLGKTSCPDESFAVHKLRLKEYVGALR